MEYLFSYGTLQRNDVQLRLFGRQLAGEKDVLPGYETAVIEINDAAFLAKGEAKDQLTATASNGASIEGTVFELTEAELLQADSYEPEGYSRIRVELVSGKEAWLYTTDK